MATAYREIAKRYPNAFALLLRFWTTGPRDLQIAEEWHQALYDAGSAGRRYSGVGFATYAAILGVCAGEIGGLLDRPSAGRLREIEGQNDLPLTKGSCRSSPAFATTTYSTRQSQYRLRHRSAGGETSVAERKRSRKARNAATGKSSGMNAGKNIG